MKEGVIMKKNYVIFGEMGSGKDTVSKLLAHNHNMKSYNIGDTVRNLQYILKKYNDINNNQLWSELLETLKCYEGYINNAYTLSSEISFDAAEALNKIKKDILNLSEDISERRMLQIMADTLRTYNVNLLNYITIGQALKENHNRFVIVGGRTYDDFYFYKNLNYTTIGVHCPVEIRAKRLLERDGVSQIKEKEHNTEIHVSEIVNKCDIIINNNGSLDDLRDMLNNI